MTEKLTVDKHLENLWNEKHPSDKVTSEQFWELCRKLEDAGYLEGNQEFVGTKTLGPFKIAYKTNDINPEDIINFFLSTIIPVLLQLSDTYSFKDFYALYLLPAIEILTKASKRIVFLTDALQWDILLYVKNQNKIYNYPTAQEIIGDEHFQSISNEDIKKALASLTSVSTLFGNTELLKIDHDGRIECLV